MRTHSSKSLFLPQTRIKVRALITFCCTNRYTAHTYTVDMHVCLAKYIHHTKNSQTE